MSRAGWLSVIGAFAFFVLAWQAVVLVGGLPPYILPPPGMVAERFVSAWADGTVWPHFVTTMVEVLLGFAVGAYQAVFHVADYYRKAGVPLPSHPFLDVVHYDFAVDQPPRKSNGDTLP